ncbi:MAG: hypothetical protein K0R17_2574, partial [Rariglobus sp.]|nr:hypothetical protein [Rariglobus sp.]
PAVPGGDPVAVPNPNASVQLPVVLQVFVAVVFAQVQVSARAETAARTAIEASRAEKGSAFSEEGRVRGPETNAAEAGNGMFIGRMWVGAEQKRLREGRCRGGLPVTKPHVKSFERGPGKQGLMLRMRESDPLPVLILHGPIEGI